MSPGEVAAGAVSFSQTLLGVLGNFTFLCQNVILHFRARKVKFTDLVTRHLTLANFLAILSREVPHTMAAWGQKHFLSDAGCKLVFYVHRVARGMSFSAVCVLSVYQAITLSPSTSRWTGLKGKASRYASLFISLCWVLHMLVNSIVCVYVTHAGSSTNTTDFKDLGYCATTLVDPTTSLLLASVLAPHSILGFGLMVVASGYMIFLLHQHGHQVRYIQRLSLSKRPSAETRAAQKILALVGLFFSFYLLSAVLATYMVFSEPSLWVLNTSAIIHSCFPTLSPFVLMWPGLEGTRPCRACCRRP